MPQQTAPLQTPQRWSNYWKYRKVWYRYICYIWPQGTETNTLWWQWCIHITENFTPSKDSSLELSDDRKRFHCLWSHYIVSQELWPLTNSEHAPGRSDRFQLTKTSFFTSVWREGFLRSKSSGKLYNVKWEVVTDTSNNCRVKCCTLLWPLHPEEGTTILWNVSTCIPSDTKTHTKRPWSSETLLWETQSLLVQWRGFCWP